MSFVIPVNLTTMGGTGQGGWMRAAYVPSSSGMPSGPKISAAISMMLHLDLEKPVVSRSKTTYKHHAHLILFEFDGDPPSFSVIIASSCESVGGVLVVEPEMVVFTAMSVLREGHVLLLWP